MAVASVAASWPRSSSDSSRLPPGLARVLLIETSSTPQYEATRAFYSVKGYTHEATVRDFYGPGDDKIVFWKLLDQP